MTGSMRAWPSREKANALYARLTSGDPTATADIVLAYLEPLSSWLEARNPKLHPHDCATASEDALLELIKRPETYKSELLSLEAYLRMSASGDLKNLLRSERRHSLRRAPLEVVELPRASGNYLVGGTAAQSETHTTVVGDEVGLVPAAVLESVRSTATPEESRVLDLMVAGERRTAEYVAALGLTDLKLERQRQEVKRVKDRLKKRLERVK